MRPRLLPGLPLVAAFVLAATSGLPQMRTPVELAWSVLGTAVLLAGWSLWLYDHVLRQGRTLRLVVNLRAQHYVQAGAQTTVLVYWGFYWPVVPESLLLVTAQLVFAYAFDMLLGWSRRDTYALGFGPIPVVLSTSLFLWFKAEWFYLQFLLIAVGFLAKELIQWKKAGRRVHVFNPSALPLALFSVVLIATGTTDMTWGAEIAATLNNAPWIYVVIVLAAFPGQALFGGTPMTLSAAVTMYLFGLLYFASTGTYFFVDSYIPIAVFLGMHLLFTDPSTSPQSERGRLVFGALYALSVVGLYAVLARLGVPTFYDKLLAVPLLNLMVTVIDRVLRKTISEWISWASTSDTVRPDAVTANAATEAVRSDPLTAGAPMSAPRRLAYVGVWAVVFVAMTVAHAVGDIHRGQWVTFWLAACHEGRTGGCFQAARLLSVYCANRSGWACNEYGILLQPDRRPALAVREFQRACDLGFSAGCVNLDQSRVSRPLRARPGPDDLRVVLRRKQGVRDLGPLELRQLACRQGFLNSC